MAGTEIKISASGEKSNTTASSAGGSAVATIAAAADTKTYVVMAIISSEGTTPALGRATLTYTKDGVAQTIGLRFPASAFAPVVLNFGSHPIEGDANTAVVLTVPALSAAIQEATLVYYQRLA